MATDASQFYQVFLSTTKTLLSFYIVCMAIPYPYISAGLPAYCISSSDSDVEPITFYCI